MKTPVFRSGLSCCIAIALSFSAISVQGKKQTQEDSNYADITTIPTFYITTDGQKYTGLSRQKHPLASWRVSVQFNYSAPDNDLIKNYHLQLRMKWNQGGRAETFKGSHVYKRVRPRKNTIRRTEWFPIDGIEVESFLVNACNAMADSVRSSGLSNSQIFGQNRQIKAKIYASHAVGIQWVPGGFTNFYGALPDRYADIVCMKAPVRRVSTPKKLKLGSAVTSSSLNIIKQSTLGGACKVNLSTAIRTNLPNTTVKYRFEHSHGKKSDIKTVKTSHSKIAMDAHWYNIPKQAQSGRFRIIGVSHNFKSAWKRYSITCNAAAPSGLSVVTKPTAKLSLTPFQNINHRGMICPSRVKIVSTLRSDKAFIGTGIVVIKQGRVSFPSHNVNLKPNISWRFNEIYNLKPWNTVNTPAGRAGGSNTFQNQSGANRSVPSQRFRIRYALSKNNKNILLTPYKTVVVRCKPARVNPGLPSRGGLGINRPHTQSRRAGQRTNQLNKRPGQRCRRGRFPKNAVIRHAGRQRAVRCVNGRIRLGN